MATACYKCGEDLGIALNSVISRNATCSKCKSDLRCCFNCKFFDKQSYNECKEPQADRVVDKDRSNFCDYFSLREGQFSGKNSEDKNKKLSELDNLFKRK